MVAITVVLAAVLYLMVSQFTGGGSASAPTGTISGSSATAGNETLDFGRFSPDTAPSEIKMLVTFSNDTATGVGECEFTGDGDGPLTCSKTSGPSFAMDYSDNADNKLLNVGDSIFMFGSTTSSLADGTWVITMLHIDTGETISDTQFTK